jgi:hypothetical protein
LLSFLRKRNLAPHDQCKIANPLGAKVSHCIVRNKIAAHAGMTE